ncbi:hypothetical protein C8F01DRAFT_668660 [Mycena amicta]|nr:hypothetical protein C8F01DRAFT_668660 [Mycena amicta]
MNDFPDEITEKILDDGFRHTAWSIPYGAFSPFPSLPPVTAREGSLDALHTLRIVGVCRAWYRIGIRRLYQDIVLRHIDQLPFLVRTFEKQSDLGAMVQNLNIAYYLNPGWTALHLSESTKLLALCPNLSRLTMGGRAFYARYPDDHLPLAPVPRDYNDQLQVPLPLIPPAVFSSLLHLNIADEYVRYDDTFPLLCPLAANLRTLSIALQDDLPAYDRPHLTFPALTDLRLTLHFSSRVGHVAEQWAFPALETLAIMVPPWGDLKIRYRSYRSRIVNLIETIIRGPTKTTFTRLILPDFTDYDPRLSPERTWFMNFETMQAILDECPALRWLCMSVTVCSPTRSNMTQALVHPHIEALDITGRMNEHNDATTRVDLAFLKSGMPRLRRCRFVDRGMAFFADTLPDLLEGLDPNDGAELSADELYLEHDPSVYRPPADTWLSYLLSIPVGDGDDDDEDTDGDFEPESESESESESSGSEWSITSSDAECDIRADLDAAGYESDVEWEVEREDAMVTFADGVRRAQSRCVAEQVDVVS